MTAASLLLLVTFPDAAPATGADAKVEAVPAQSATWILTDLAEQHRSTKQAATAAYRQELHRAAIQAAAMAYRHKLHLLHLDHLATLRNLHRQAVSRSHVRTWPPRTSRAHKAHSRSHAKAHASRVHRPASRTWVATSPIRARIIAAAARYKGQPYVYGGLDCSGLTQRAYRAVGIHLPRSARDQQRFARRVRSPRPGDLVFYGYPAYHVAIYLRPGWMIVARHTGTVIQEQRIYGNPTYATVLI